MKPRPAQSGRGRPVRRGTGPSRWPKTATERGPAWRPETRVARGGEQLPVLALDVDMSARPSDAPPRRPPFTRALAAASGIADGLLEQRPPGIARRLSARERRVEGAMALAFLATAV